MNENQVQRTGRRGICYRCRGYYRVGHRAATRVCRSSRREPFGNADPDAVLFLVGNRHEQFGAGRAVGIGRDAAA